jgi:hypothetical protein
MLDRLRPSTGVVVDDEEAQRELLRARNDAANALQQTLHSQRMSAVRSLQVANAGGAVALLAFLGQTWSAASELRMALVITIGLMVVGLLLAVWGGFQLPTYSEQGFRKNESSAVSNSYHRTRRLYLWTVRLSFLAFVSAVLLLLVRVVVVS